MRGEADLHCKPLPPTLPLPPFLFRFPTARGKCQKGFSLSLTQGARVAPGPTAALGACGSRPCPSGCSPGVSGAACPENPLEIQRNLEIWALLQAWKGRCCGWKTGAASHLFSSSFWPSAPTAEDEGLRSLRGNAFKANSSSEFNFELIRLPVSAKHHPITKSLLSSSFPGKRIVLVAPGLGGGRLPEIGVTAAG